ncbi:MAG: hypothetical protein NWR12_01705, partial [Haliea sp.]|nr:hypothetical protein [Haliea sp.]
GDDRRYAASREIIRNHALKKVVTGLVIHGACEFPKGWDYSPRRAQHTALLGPAPDIRHSPYMAQASGYRHSGCPAYLQGNKCALVPIARLMFYTPAKVRIITLSF